MFKNIDDDIIHSECMVGRFRYLNKFVIKKLYYGNNKPNSNDNMISCYLEDFVSNPLICKDKDLAPMYKIGVPYRKELDVNDDPVELITMLLLDYDNESMDSNLLSKFCDKFNDYKFYLYTTFNSTYAFKRFRVILPLKNVIYSAYLSNSHYIDYLTKEFTVGDEKPDKSCFLSSQMQIVPVTKDINLYKYVINKGKRFKLKSYEEVLENANNVIRNKINNFKLLSANELVTLKNEINNVTLIKVDEEYNKRFSEEVNCAKTSNFSKSDKYKNAEIKLKEKGIEKVRVFNTKFDFIKFWLPKVVTKKKINIFYEEWLKYYGSSIRSSNKWFVKFKSCLNSYLAKKNISEDNLI